MRMFRTGRAPLSCGRDPPPACERAFHLNAAQTARRSGSKIDQAQADLQGFVYPLHRLFAKSCNPVRQALLIDRSNLFKQDDGIPIESMRFRIDFYVGRQFRFLNLGGNRRDDDRRAEAIADIVLNNQYRPYSALLGPHHRR